MGRSGRHLNHGGCISGRPYNKRLHLTARSFGSSWHRGRRLREFESDRGFALAAGRCTVVRGGRQVSREPLGGGERSRSQVRRALLIVGLAAAAAFAFAVFIRRGHDHDLRFPAPGGQVELVVPESGTSVSTFYVVPAGSRASVADEVLRTEIECPEFVAQGALEAGATTTEREPICGSTVGFGWSSATEVEFTLSNSVRVLKQVEQIHGVTVRTRRVE